MQTTHHRLSDGATLEIREAERRDAALVLEYIETISGETDFMTFGPGEFELTVEQEADFLHACRRSPLQVYLLGFVGGELVASLNLSARDRARLRHTGELGMSVLAAHWGRGIGSLLLAALIDWARATGVITKINLRVRTDNPRAIALYERHGFGLEGTVTREMLIDGVYRDNHAMGLEL